ncbi:nuclear transport factor 2 family protein [Streptomyces sp. cg40]|uniref:nuclear transport factor 2 family protein n=1 Tax=Streptomyces sp. cg40 TaxID=3419764 RepID=UPI003D059801
MDDFIVAAGVATITDPAFFSNWLDRPDYFEALAASPDPAVTAKKRLVIDFEAELARLVVSGRIDKEIDAVLERFIADDYIQHDPNFPGNGRAALAASFRAMPTPPVADVPAPPVGVMVEEDLVCLLMQKPMPDPADPSSTYDWFIPTVFRVRDGKLTEHWGAFKKGAP